MAELGEKIRHARERLGMTQQTLADKLYVSRQCVSRWELGERYPDIMMIKLLSRELEVSISDLIDDENVDVISSKKNGYENKYLTYSIFGTLVTTIILMIIYIMGKFINYQAGIIVFRNEITLLFTLLSYCLQLSGIGYGLVKCIKESIRSIDVAYMTTLIVLGELIQPVILLYYTLIYKTEILAISIITMLTFVIYLGFVCMTYSYFQKGKNEILYYILVIMISLFMLKGLVFNLYRMLVSINGHFYTNSLLQFVNILLILSFGLFYTLQLIYKHQSDNLKEKLIKDK